MSKNLVILDKNTLFAVLIGLLTISGLMMALILYPLTIKQPLPIVSDAPDFTLTNQDGETVSLSQLEGKVVLINFMYTSCEDAEFCPLMTSHLKLIGNDLGDKLGTEVMFLSVTLDPMHDTPEVMRNYGELHGVDFTGWQFLTGNMDTVQKVLGDYGVVAFTQEDIGSTDHTNHTDAEGNTIIHNWVIKLIDQEGKIRKDYTKTSWIIEAAKNDILSLL
ncbi:MAG: SCO family protein [Candidatus Odinarchaeota archaeon]